MNIYWKIQIVVQVTVHFSLLMAYATEKWL